MICPGTTLLVREVHSAVQEVDNVCAVGGILFRVGHLDDRHSFVVLLFEEFHDLFALPGVEVTGRLIGEE